MSLRGEGTRKYAYGWADIAAILDMIESTARSLANEGKKFDPADIHSVLRFRETRKRARRRTAKEKQAMSEPIHDTECCASPSLVWSGEDRSYQCASCRAWYGPIVLNLVRAETRAVQIAMERSDMRISDAAALLGLTRHALRRRLEKFGLYGHTPEKKNARATAPAV